MYLEIVSPEATLFSGEVKSVTVPGINGEVQMLKDHAPVVSLLQNGNVIVDSDEVMIEEEFESKFLKDGKGRTILAINSGTIEMKDNKVIVLAD